MTWGQPVKPEEEIFRHLNDWRKLPGYQTERRADLFFTVYLGEVLDRYVAPVNRHIVPEFPLRKAESNRSYKADYVMCTKECQKLLLIELKTDMGSMRIDQVRYLAKAARKQPSELLADIGKISSATRERAKYERLRLLLTDLGMQLEPAGIAGECRPQSTELVFLLPQKRLPDKIKREIDSFRVPYHLVGFDEFAAIVDRRDDDLSSRFASSLRLWAGSPPK